MIVLNKDLIIKMNNSVENYLQTNSLFKTTNSKFVSPYLTEQSNITKTYTPVREIYAPTNPLNPKVKEALLCRSCKQKQNSSCRKYHEVNELQQIERNMKERDAATNSFLRSEEYEVKNINQFERGPRYLANTVQYYPKKNQDQLVLKKTQPPSIVIPETSPRPSGYLGTPITQQIEINQESEKEAIPQKPKEIVFSDKSSANNLNIIINKNPSKQLYKESPSPYEQSVIKSKSQTERLTPTVYPFSIRKTESNFMTLAQPAQEGSSKDIKRHLNVLSASPKVSTFRSSIIKNEANTNLCKESSHFDRLAPVSSIASHSILNSNTGRGTTLNLNLTTTNRQILFSKNLADRDNFFNSTKRDSSKYIQNIQLLLRQSYHSLEQIQKEIDSLIEKNLQLQCEKIKSNLYKAIEIEIKDFRETERKQLTASKFKYMSDLYELKCNIDLRLQELEDYQGSFNSQHKWKEIVGDLLTPDYQSSIEFLITKTEEIQGDSLSYTQNFLAEYNSKMFVEVLEPLKKEMKLAIQNLFLNFSNLREKRMGQYPNNSFLSKYFQEEGKNYADTSNS